MAKEPKKVKKNPILEDGKDAAADEAAEDTDVAADSDESDEDESEEDEDTEESEDTDEPVASKKATGKSKVAEKQTVSDGKNAAEALHSDIVRTRKQLEADVKVNFFVPLGQGEKKGAIEQVWINGAEYKIPKGRMVSIPQTVANILAEHYQLTEEAGADKRIDGNEAAETALL